MPIARMRLAAGAPEHIPPQEQRPCHSRPAHRAPASPGPQPQGTPGRQRRRLALAGPTQASELILCGPGLVLHLPLLGSHGAFSRVTCEVAVPAFLLEDLSTSPDTLSTQELEAASPAHAAQLPRPPQVPHLTQTLPLNRWYLHLLILPSADVKVP